MSLASLTRVWEHSRQKGSALVLTLALADIGNDDGFSFPGLDWLAERTRMSRRQTQRLLDQLQAENEIYMQQRNRGRGHTPEYLVLAGLDAGRIKNSLIKYFDMDEATALEKGDKLSQRVTKRRPFREAIKGDKLSVKGDISGNKRRHAHAQNGDTRNTPDSNTPSESVLGESESALVKAISEITGSDPRLNQVEVADLVRDLSKIGYSAQDVLDWHQGFWKNYWRSRGGSPSLKEVRQFIGWIAAQRNAQPDDAEDPYIADLERHGISSLDAEEIGERWPARPEKKYWGTFIHPWLATLGQLQIQLNRSTYDTWLRHLELIDVVECENDTLHFQATVPHGYAKDWLERHLLASFERTLCDICQLPSCVMSSGRNPTQVKITLEVPDEH